MTHSVELLMPAGTKAKMNLAFDYGADAVYLGPPLYSLRARENHFGNDELKSCIEQAHLRGKKAYMTLNIFSRNRKLKPFREDIVDLASMKPDAFIISDPGLGMIAKEMAPQIPIHLSVQANCMNWQSVKFWRQSLQIERVILSRELSIAEISEVKQRVPEVELEAFVHGSICIAYSGRCLLSSYMDKRDANQGICDNSCREKYAVWEKEIYLEDQMHQPGSYYRLDEDQHGTYVLNAKDLCMIEHLDKLIKAGVVSFKVEGRTKSEFYAAMVARSYRGALNDLQSGLPFNFYWLKELEKLTNRGYHTAFMLENPGAQGQNYEASTRYNTQTQLVGIVQDATQDESLVDIKNKMHINQTLQWISPNGKSGTAQVESIRTLDGKEKIEVHSGSGRFYVKMKNGEIYPERSLLINSFQNL